MTEAKHDSHTLLQRLEASLDDGNLADARRADLELRRGRGDGTVKVSRSQDRRVAVLHRRMHELRDWQHWANNERRLHLCEKVEALKDSDLHPDALFQALQDAQQEWKHLEEQEKLPGESGAYLASGPTLWHRFQASCNELFEHIRPFLRKRSEMREQNLAAVNQLIERLQAFSSETGRLNGAQVSRELSQARQTLRQLHELPPPRRGKIAKRLRPLIAELSERLKAQDDVTAERKRDLIEEARQLDADRLDESIAEAKRINERWKKLGGLPRGRERKLWKELRNHIGPLFEARDASRAHEEAALDEQRKEWQALCDEAEALAADDELSGEELDARARDLRGRWRAADVRDKRLRKRFDGARAGIRKRLEELDARKHFDRIRERFARAGRDTPAGTTRETDSEDAAHLCLTMELLADIDSPPKAAQARMDLKVRRLNDRLRGDKGADSVQDEFEAAFREWCDVPSPVAHTDEFRDRVKRALEAFYGQSLHD